MNPESHLVLPRIPQTLVHQLTHQAKLGGGASSNLHPRSVFAKAWGLKQADQTRFMSDPGFSSPPSSCPWIPRRRAPPRKTARAARRPARAATSAASTRVVALTRSLGQAQGQRGWNEIVSFWCQEQKFLKGLSLQAPTVPLPLRAFLLFHAGVCLFVFVYVKMLTCCVGLFGGLRERHRRRWEDVVYTHSSIHNNCYKHVTSIIHTQTNIMHLGFLMAGL